MRVHLLISGIVQGVSFRYFTVREAERLGVRGWVRNLPSGEVEAVAEGAPDAVEHFVAWCRHGPLLARVDDVNITHEKPKGETGFSLTR
ncbi:MAG: acylphosphatase [Deltaproteobacteria bacterium]|nr:acylphosphatase [Deltaproteobacteria bacterium]